MDMKMQEGQGAWGQLKKMGKWHTLTLENTNDHRAHEIALSFVLLCFNP